PALKEPINFTFYIEGQKILEAVPRIGYVHRGIEKLAESRTYIQNAYLVERTCGICSATHLNTYCEVIEQLAEMSVPIRAQYIRALILELERLHSHSLWVGIVGHEVGFETLFMNIWKDREIVMRLLEAISGNRVNYGMCCPGGVRRDLSTEIIKQILEGLDELADSWMRYRDIILQDPSINRRTKNVGVLGKERAMELGTVGPTARASGISWDVRKNLPYCIYGELEFDVIVNEKGDVMSRLLSRVDEYMESIRICRQILDQIPGGEISGKEKRRMPSKWASARSEAPRGELFYAIKGNDTDKPERLKIRTPTLANMQAMSEMLHGQYVADIPVIIAGIDPCISCMDRVTIVDIEKPPSDRLMIRGEHLRQYGIQWYRDQFGAEN
ncbi:MAG TPA: nickel-dependent hydrogenase large subunit, partial [Candidatus Hodarchaeales archaeon]|nr:nickel-dependent hydrogenase large subunit [Candidatus Hodarchaeales archaeon]